MSLTRHPSHAFPPKFPARCNKSRAPPPPVNSWSCPPARPPRSRASCRAAAQVDADFLVGGLGELGARRLERGLVDLVLHHPVAGEFAGLKPVDASRERQEGTRSRAG